MTTAERTAGPRPRRGPRSLRLRLLLVLVALLAVVCAAVGWITVVAMQDFLIGQLDAQLTSAGGRAVNAAPSAAGQGGGSAPGQSGRSSCSFPGRRSARSASASRTGRSPRPPSWAATGSSTR